MESWSWSWRRLLLTLLFVAALVELEAANTVQEDPSHGTALSSGGGEALLWYLPAAVGAVALVSLLVILCVSGDSRRNRSTTTEPFLSASVAPQQVGADHVYVNQTGHQQRREEQAGRTSVSPVPSGQSTPQYDTINRVGGLLQNVYIPADGAGAEGTSSADLAQRGYEVPRASVKDQGNGTESRTNLYVNEVVQSREGKVHAFYHAPQQERADLYNTEMDAAGQGRSVIPPTISPPPTIPERQAVPTEEEPRSEEAQNDPKPKAHRLQKTALLSLPSFADTSMQTPKLSPLPTPTPSLSSKISDGKELKYREPPNTERLIQENFRDMNCPTIPSKELRLGERLGQGYFATVHSAVWTSRHGQFDVAVKKLKSRASAEERVKFLQEAVIMAQFFHPNIVQLCGMTQDTMQGIVLELLPNGSLKSYLEACRKYAQHYPEGQIASALLLFAQQVASGMNYLANKEFVHRDLAARNIFLDADYVCKIGDFGLARGIAGESYYTAKSGQIPVKWTAPEALEFNRYTSASDVWSYGVLLFEMWSLGRQPMADKRNAEISRHLNGGYRMPPPPGCSRGIYKLMIKCWHPDPKKRPTFGMVYGAIEAKGLELLTMDSSVSRSNTVDTNANVIGANLAAGEGLYRDLQVAYR